MLNTIIILIAILPSILLGFYVYKVDKVEKEPKRMLFTLFVLGCTSTLPVIFAEVLLADIFPIMDNGKNSGGVTNFLSSFVLTGLIEEGAKWCFTYFYIWKNKEFNHIYDAIIYSVFVSLGFATVENILYVSSYGLTTAIIRAIISVPGHAFFGVFMGYYLGFSKINLINGRFANSTRNKILSLFVPIVLHGTFNFCLVSDNTITYIALAIFVVSLYVFSFRKINKLSKIDTMLYNSKNIIENNCCPNCHSISNTKYCSNCGNLIL